MTIITHLDDPVLLTSGLDQRHAFLRDISGLERNLQRVLKELSPRNRPRSATVDLAHPHLLSIDELELVCSSLAAALGEAEEALAAQTRSRRAKRALLKRMLEQPVKFRWARVTSVDLGEPGCHAWQSLPQLGIIGMLANWWRVRMSSGCP